MYKVHIGYTRAGRDRWKRFPTLESANAFCEKVRAVTGTILTIIADTPKLPRSVRLYDNGGKSYDRYTAVFTDRPYATPRTSGLYEALAFNDSPFHPLGFGLHTSAMPGRHLGKRIKFETMSPDAQKFVLQNLD